MPKKEIYDAKEYNTFDEFKKFDSFEYYVVKENKGDIKELFSVNEAESIEGKGILNNESLINEKSVDPKLLKEDNNKETTKKNNNDKASTTSAISKTSDTVIKKIIESSSSITSMVTGSVVTATVAVAVCSTILINNPKATINIVDRGMDYVSYSIDVEELNEDIKYYLLLNGNGADYSIDIPTVGTYSDIISGLKPHRAYKLQLVGENGEIGGTTTYEEKSFYTLKGADPSATISYEYFNSNSFSYQCYFSDYDKVGENYYIEVMKDGEAFYTNYSYVDGYIKDTFVSLDDGIYSFNVYGTIYEEKVLLKNETLSLPYGVSGERIENVSIEVEDSINVKGEYIASVKDNTLTYSFDFFNNGTLISSVSKDFKCDDKFEFNVDIIEGADTFSLSILRKGKVLYSNKNGVIYSVPIVKGTYSLDYNKLIVNLKASHEFKLSPEVEVVLFNGDNETKNKKEVSFIDNEYNFDVDISSCNEYLINVYYDSQLIYSSSKTLISYPKVQNMEEIHTQEGVVLLMQVEGNYSSGKVVYKYNDIENEVEFEIKNNYIQVTLPINPLSRSVMELEYKVYVEDKLIYVKEKEVYEVDEFILYNKLHVDELDYSFNDSNKLDIKVPLSFESQEGYQVEVLLYDLDNNLLDTKISLGEEITFTNIDIKEGYKIAYKDLRKINSLVYTYSEVYFDEVFNIILPSFTLNDITYTDEEIVIPYEVSSSSNIKKVILNIDKDGIKDQKEFTLVDYPSSYSYPISNSVNEVNISLSIEVNYPNIKASYYINISEDNIEPVLEMKLINEKEILASNKFALSGEIKNNRYLEGKLVFISDQEEQEETFNIVNNKFYVSIDIDNISSYGYKIILDDEVLFNKDSKDYEVIYPITYSKKSFSELDKEFDEYGRLIINVDLELESSSGYKVLAYIYNEENETIDYAYVTSEAISLMIDDLSKTYYLGYQEFYEDEYNEFIFNTNQDNIPISFDDVEIELLEELKYDSSGKVSIYFNHSSLDSVKDYEIKVIDIDTNEEYECNYYSLEGGYVSLLPPGDEFNLKAEIILTYEGIANTRSVYSEVIAYMIDRMEVGTPYFNIRDSLIYVPIYHPSFEDPFIIKVLDEEGSTFTYTNLSNGALEIYSFNEGENIFYISLVDNDNNILALVETVRFNYSPFLMELPFYSFNSVNCGDVQITYSSEGTVTLDFANELEVESEDVYAYILLMDGNRVSKYKLLGGNMKIESLEVTHDTHLGLGYQIVYRYNNEEYVVNETIVSGTIDFTGIAVGEINSNYIEEDDTLELEIQLTDIYNSISEIKVDVSAYSIDGEMEYLDSDSYIVTYEDSLLKVQLNVPSIIVEFNIDVIIIGDNYSLYLYSDSYHKDIEPSITLNEENIITPSGQFKIEYTLDNVAFNCSYEIEFSVDLGLESPLIILDEDVVKSDNEGYALVNVPSGILEISVTPKIYVKHVLEEAKVYEKETMSYGGLNLSYDKMIYDENAGTLKMYFKDLPYELGDNQIYLFEVGSEEKSYASLIENYIIVEGIEDNNETKYFELSMKDNSGNYLTIPSIIGITLDTSSLTKDEVVMNAPNPGEVRITYNDDASANLEFDMRFNNNGVSKMYYAIELTEILGGVRTYYISNASSYTITNLPTNTSYTLKYYKCELSHFVYYIYDEVYPSGSVNFQGMKIGEVNETRVGNTVDATINLLSILGKNIDSVNGYIIFIDDMSNEESYITPTSESYNSFVYNASFNLPEGQGTYYYKLTIYTDEGKNEDLYSEIKTK